MIKSFALASAFTFALAMPAFADQCQDDVAKVDAALTTAQLDSDVKTEVTDLREQAIQLCGAGNNQEGLDVLAEAKVKLNIE